MFGSVLRDGEGGRIVVKDCELTGKARRPSSEVVCLSYGTQKILKSLLFIESDDGDEQLSQMHE